MATLDPRTDAHALYQSAVALFGQGRRCSSRKGAQLMGQAAEAGHVGAMSLLGAQLLSGRAIAPDPVTGIRLILAAAERGGGYACAQAAMPLFASGASRLRGADLAAGARLSAALGRTRIRTGPGAAAAAGGRARGRLGPSASRGQPRRLAQGARAARIERGAIDPRLRKGVHARGLRLDHRPRPRAARAGPGLRLVHRRRDTARGQAQQRRRVRPGRHGPGGAGGARAPGGRRRPRRGQHGGAPAPALRGRRDLRPAPRFPRCREGGLRPRHRLPRPEGGHLPDLPEPGLRRRRDRVPRCSTCAIGGPRATC